MVKARSLHHLSPSTSFASFRHSTKGRVGKGVSEASERSATLRVLAELVPRGSLGSGSELAVLQAVLDYIADLRDALTNDPKPTITHTASQVPDVDALSDLLLRSPSLSPLSRPPSPVSPPPS